MRAGWMIAMVMAAGCGGGRGSLLLGITASPPIAGVDEVQIVVTDGAGRPSLPAVHPLMPATDLGAMPLRLNLQLPREVRGKVTVKVTARKGGSDKGTGMAEGTVADGVENEVNLRIGDGSMGDMAMPADLDMAAPPDLSVVPDMAACPVEDREWALWPMPNPPGTGLPNTASYDTSAPGIVKDRMTGLEWQRDVDPSSYKWADAKDYCAKLQLQGGCWRLPTMVELMSLVDFTVIKSVTTDAGTQYPPKIDVSAFPDTPSDVFWTSSPLAGDPSRAWYVDFSSGSSSTSGVGYMFRVRCMR